LSLFAIAVVLTSALSVGAAGARRGARDRGRRPGRRQGPTLVSTLAELLADARAPGRLQVVDTLEGLKETESIRALEAARRQGIRA